MLSFGQLDIGGLFIGGLKDQEQLDIGGLFIGGLKDQEQLNIGGLKGGPPTKNPDSRLFAPLIGVAQALVGWHPRFAFHLNLASATKCNHYVIAKHFCPVSDYYVIPCKRLSYFSNSLVPRSNSSLWPVCASCL